MKAVRWRKIMWATDKQMIEELASQSPYRMVKKSGQGYSILEINPVLQRRTEGKAE